MAYDTSKLKNGTGIAALVSNTGKNFGFVTYKSFHLDGEYYMIDTLEEFALRGILRYDTSCLNYTPGVKVKYLAYADKINKVPTDTAISVFDSALFLEIFKYSTANIIETEFAMVPPMVFDLHPDLQTGFIDHAVVPIGR